MDSGNSGSIELEIDGKVCNIKNLGDVEGKLLLITLPPWAKDEYARAVWEVVRNMEIDAEALIMPHNTGISVSGDEEDRKVVSEFIKVLEKYHGG